MARRQQPKKDSNDPRVNFDNERESKFDKEYERKPKSQGRSSGSKQPGAKPKGGNKPNQRTEAAAGNKGYVRRSLFTRNPELLEAAGRIASNYISGFPISTAMVNFSTAGVMRLEYHMTPVANDNPVLTQAMNDQYSFVVHANSRNYNYNAAALYSMEIAGSEIFAAIALGFRAYGLMQSYSGASVYLPKALIQASGFNFESLRDTYATMWSDLSQLVARAQQIWIPSVMNFAKRWWDLNIAVYCDTESINDQYYMFTPVNFHKIELQADGTYALKYFYFTPTGLYPTQVGQLQTQPAENYTNTSGIKVQSMYLEWSQYLRTVNEMIDAIAKLQDRGMIYGDLLNAFGAQNLFSISYPDMSFKTPIVYDLSTLHAIMNTTLSPFIPGDIIYQPKTDKLIQKWDSIAMQTKRNGSVPQIWIQDPILNYRTQTLTPEFVAEVTRFMTVGIQDGVKFTTGSCNYGELQMPQFDATKQNRFIDSLTYADPTTTPATVGTFCGPWCHGTEVVTAVTIFFNASPWDVLGNGKTEPQPATDKDGVHTYNVRMVAGAYYASRFVGFQHPTTNDIVPPSYDPFYQYSDIQSEGIKALLAQFDWRPIQYTFGTIPKQTGLDYSIARTVLLGAEVGGTTASGKGVPGMMTNYISFEAENIVQVQPEQLKTLHNVCLESLAGVPISLSLTKTRK